MDDGGRLTVNGRTRGVYVRLCENEIEPQNIEQACLTAVKADREPQNVEVEYASIHVY